MMNSYYRDKKKSRREYEERLLLEAMEEGYADIPINEDDSADIQNNQDDIADDADEHIQDINNQFYEMIEEIENAPQQPPNDDPPPIPNEEQDDVKILEDLLKIWKATNNK